MTSSAPIDRVLDALTRAGIHPKQNGKHWAAQCPAHQDRMPSLSISPGADGRVLLHCHAGCTTDAILSELHLAPRDLFADEPPKRDDQRPTWSNATARYPYVDENGQTVYVVTRHVPKTFRQWHPDSGGRMKAGRGDHPIVPYRLPQLQAAIAGRDLVLLVEGEKDADAAHEAGLVATTFPMGAGKWQDGHARWFAGGDVVIVADRDRPGYEHAHAALVSLEQVCASVTVVRAKTGKDLADHLAAGLTVDDLEVLTRDDVEEALAKAANLDPAPTSDFEPSLSVEEPETPAVPLTIRWVRDTAEHPPPRPEVLVDGLIRAGELAVVGAPRAIGKSWLAMNVATKLARGPGHKLFESPDLTVQKRCNVLLAQGELDYWGSHERWMSLTGDRLPERVGETFDRWQIRTYRQREQRGPTSRESVTAEIDPRLVATLDEHPIDLLIIDPWAVYFGGSENSNDEVEAALAQLRHLTLDRGIAVLIFHHIGKSTDVREPEDLWRGASRLADWASTRVTLLPHYTATQAQKAGLSRREARRYADVHFLRRAEPTDDRTIHLESDGWWHQIDQQFLPRGPEEEAVGGRPSPLVRIEDLVDAVAEAGGSVPSLKQLADLLGASHSKTKRLADRAVVEGALIERPGPHNATAFWLPGIQADLDV